MQAGKNREIDIVFSAQKTLPRLINFDFTTSVLIQQNKIIVSNEKNDEYNLKYLFDKDVAVVDNSAIYEHLKLNYPRINLIATKTELEALQMISDKAVDVAISESVRASYNMKVFDIDNIHIAGDVNYNYNLCIASRNDIPIINIILDKTINMIPVEDLKSLQLKWGYSKDREAFFDRDTLIFISVILILVMLFSLYVLMINKRIKFLNNTLERRVAQEVERNKQQQLMILQQNRLSQMGEIISMIAHQWRQPLSLLNSSVLKIDYMLEESDFQHNDIENELLRIERTTKYMSTTIDDFRNFFKPQKEKKIFNLSDSLNYAIELLLPIFKEEKIELKVSIPDDCYITGYSNELSQSVINILNNAKDALIESNTSDKYIDVALTQTNSEISLKISDNAGGISDDIIDKVFEPYFSTKNEVLGTGLGLYMSKMIIEKYMNGKIEVCNKNSGAFFEITLEYNGSIFQDQ